MRMLFFVLVLTAGAIACGSSDDSSIFGNDGGDANDSSILDDVTFQPLDASKGD